MNKSVHVAVRYSVVQGIGKDYRNISTWIAGKKLPDRLTMTNVGKKGLKC